MHQAESKRCSLKPNPSRSAILGQVFVAVVPINFRGTDHAIPALKCDILPLSRRDPRHGETHEAAGIYQVNRRCRHLTDALAARRTSAAGGDASGRVSQT